jgi:hypothetical protein
MRKERRLEALKRGDRRRRRRKKKRIGAFMAIAHSGKHNGRNGQEICRY